MTEFWEVASEQANKGKDITSQNVLRSFIATTVVSFHYTTSEYTNKCSVVYLVEVTDLLKWDSLQYFTINTLQSGEKADCMCKN